MLTVDLSTIDLNQLLERINSWDDWYRIEKKVFKIDQWPELDIDEVEKMLTRKAVVYAGKKWECTSANYDIEPELEYIYEKTRQFVFEKLEPLSAMENKTHPEWYGKQCIFCRRWTRDYQQQQCPCCDRELLIIPLNDE